MNTFNFLAALFLHFFIVVQSLQDGAFSSQSTPVVFEERITNGIRAKQGQFPWAVHITQELLECTGFVVGRKTILTAAHCFPSKMKGTSIFAQVGNVSIKRSKTIPIIRAISHPLYEETTFKNDIAILVAEVDIPNVRPICVEGSAISHKQKRVVTMGWGRTDYTECMEETGETSDQLMYQFQTIIGEDQSLIYLRSNQTSNCKGDSGGPLVEIRNDGSPVAIGILSTVKPRGNEQFTRLSSFRQFIQETTNDVQFC